MTTVDSFVDAAALLESLEGNSTVLEDEKDTVLSSGLKGEIVNEGGDVGRGHTVLIYNHKFSYHLCYQEKQLKVKVSKVGQT